MQSAPLTPEEPRRLDILNSLGVLDTPSDPVLDGFVRATAQLIGCPISLVSLVDAQRQWFKARHGLDTQQTPRDQSFCAHAIMQTDLFEVVDARLDPRFADNPLVTGEPNVIFYAGVPLSVEGQSMGTLCVIDHQPRRLTEEQRHSLKDMARVAEQWLQKQVVNHQLQRVDAERRSLFDQLGDGILLLDRNYRVVEANRATAGMLGRCTEELRQMHLHDLLPASEHPRLPRTAKDVREGNEELAEWEVLRRDGSSFMAEVSTRMLDDQRFVAVIRDITQRHEQEEKVRLLSMAVEQSAQSIVIADLDGNIEYVNASVLSTSGYSSDELLGRTPHMLLSDQLPPATYTRMWRMLVTGKPWRGLIFSTRKDGEAYVEDATITPIRDARGKVTQYMAMMLDVTERRQLIKELREHQLHLEELVEQRTVALVEARRVAEAANEAKSAFLATMSHEIRTPMNGVIGSLDLLQCSALSDYQRDLTDTVNESAMALLSIIDDILDFSKIEAGELKLENGPVNLVLLADSVCDALRPMATSSGVYLQMNLLPGVPDWILSDAGRLRQILNNLIGNAIKFSVGTGRAGRVELKVELCGDRLPGHLQLSVTDNGVGMAPEVLQSMFKPFVQGENTLTRRFGGTGLGLSICKRLANLMGGWVKMHSVEGEGSTLTVTLPFQAALAPPRPVVMDSTAHSTHTGPRFVPSGGPLVLVAEDNPINQKVFAQQLALLGFSVEMVSDGLEALAHWRAGYATQRHALLLTDLHMPGLDGYSLAATIRSEEPSGSRMPIVALSADALPGQFDRCRAAGMDDYLSKPVRTDILGEVVRRWLPLDDAQTPEPIGEVHCEEVDVLEVELGYSAYDDEALERWVGDDAAILADFRQRFVMSALHTIDEMRHAASSNDSVSLVNLAHRLKSSARLIGAVSLAACCDSIERSGAGCTASEMHQHMAQMEAALAHVLTCMTAHKGLHHSDADH
ncbi:MAG: hybrid sensor histidine kinase/response regulator [Betaproteobacteria bacterium HGW-Betaproteobacteria-16]|nr:MAG: hybrid sensor histidine kinase/response regulator [Betaproteobacteria bacterium HGW-Betaproteobacteria-16]